jgi:cysteine desulfurase/selenocysteine lyase
MSDQQHTISTPTTVRKPAGAFNATEIRKAFPILTRTFRGKPLVFLDSGASSQKPQVVIDAISDYYQCHHANVHRGVYALSAEATDLFEAARNRAVGFLNAGSSREVIFTKGTTEGINCIALGDAVGQAAAGFAEEVRARRFPGPEHCFGAKD